MNKKLDINALLNKVEYKDLVKRYIMLVIALVIYGFTYNIFFVQTGLILGGSGGVAILLKNYFTPSFTVLCLSIFSLILSLIFMDKRFTINSVVGSLLCPLFIELTKDITFNISTKDMMLVVICGGVLVGIANGLSSRSGLSTGGIDTIIHIIARRLKISHGTLYALINGTIIICGGFIYGYRIVLYALIVLYIISILTDKVDEVKEYITDTLSKGVTVLDSIGGYSNSKQDMLMVVVPTLEFYKTREGILAIDPDAFITITDSYQVYGENKHKKKEVK